MEQVRKEEERCGFDGETRPCFFRAHFQNLSYAWRWSCSSWGKEKGREAKEWDRTAAVHDKRFPGGTTYKVPLLSCKVQIREKTAQKKKEKKNYQAGPDSPLGGNAFATNSKGGKTLRLIKEATATLWKGAPS